MVTRTLKRNEKLFKVVGNSSYWGKFQWNFDQGKGNWVQVSGEFELSKFELLRFFCIEVLLYTTQIPIRYLTFLQVKRKLNGKGRIISLSKSAFISLFQLLGKLRENQLLWGRCRRCSFCWKTPHSSWRRLIFNSYTHGGSCRYPTNILNCIPVFICCWVSSHKRPSNPFTSSGCMQELFS